MNRLAKIILFVGSVLLLGAILSLIFTYELLKPSNRVIAQWKQPDSVSYGSSRPSHFTVVESEIDWSAYPYTERDYMIYVGLDREPEYGHWLNFPFYDRHVDAESEIKKSTVEWSDAGVTFKDTSGHILFIPKDAFVQGAK
jgi:hypothetical protein